MNIGTDRKVVLESFKEVPKEILFRSDVAGRDQIKTNRYWFDFPAQWVDQLDKDSIIGIRGAFVSRTNRLLWFNMNVKFIETRTGEEWAWYSFSIRKFLDADDTIKSLCNIWEEFYMDNIIDKAVQPGFIEPTWDRNMIILNYVFEDGKCVLRFSRPPEQGSVYSYDEQDGVERIFNIEYEFVPMNYETKILFTDYAKGVHYLDIPCWSRYQCYMTSSFSSDAIDSYLGHTRQDPYCPIKYYRLSSDSKRFWIDLYETRDHTVGVCLPEDDKDVLYIEAVVCFSASGMI